jgi:hypothetical protein
MQQIAHWLEKLGMSEYTERFAENRIDFSVLRDLTDQDLKDLGVVLGDRRKMLRAIAEMDDAPMAASSARPVIPTPIPANVERSHRRAPAFRIPLARASLSGSVADIARGPGLTRTGLSRSACRGSAAGARLQGRRYLRCQAHPDARHPVISGKSGVSVQINKLGRFTPAGIVFF